MAVLLGLPTDRNSSYKRGAAGAPGDIRRALWNEGGNPYAESGVSLRAPGVLEDAGDLDLREEAGDYERIVRRIAGFLEKGRGVVSMGGDHSVTYPIVAAYAKRFPGLHVVHVDAHPDLYPEFDGNPFSHASPFARILENVAIGSLLQIGIRTMTPPQRAVVDRYGVRVFGASELPAARAALPAGDVYVSVDLDGIDPAFAPGVSHREPGGLAVREVLELVRAIPGRVVGADVVEYNPAEDIAGLTAAVAAKFVKEFAARIFIDGQR